MYYDSSLSRTRAGYDKQWAPEVLHHFSLLSIKLHL